MNLFKKKTEEVKEKHQCYGYPLFCINCRRFSEKYSKIPLGVTYNDFIKGTLLSIENEKLLGNIINETTENKYLVGDICKHCGCKTVYKNKDN